MGFTIYYRNEEPVDEFTALRFMKEASEVVGANVDWLAAIVGIYGDG